MSHASYEPFYDEDDPSEAPMLDPQSHRPLLSAREEGSRRSGLGAPHSSTRPSRTSILDQAHSIDMSYQEDPPSSPPPRPMEMGAINPSPPSFFSNPSSSSSSSPLLSLLTPSGFRAWWSQYHNKERAIYEWTNVDNLDVFFQRGIYCILLDRALHVASLAFVISFTTFLTGCVNYPTLHHQPKVLHDLLIPQCLSKLPSSISFLLGIAIPYLIFVILRYILDTKRLLEMHNFYTHLLEIPDEDLQTVDWNLIVSRTLRLRAHMPSILNAHPTVRLDAHGITHRIMRKDNYFIALFHRDLLDLSIPSPLSLFSSGPRTPRPGKGYGILTEHLQWNLKYCILGFVFDREGQVRPDFLRDINRAPLIRGLRKRFLIMALVNALCAPLILVYLLLFYFFRYFEEYHRTPASLGSRRYSSYAQWKFREYDELPHILHHRLHSSHEDAMAYLDQFPKEKTTMAARFVAFIAGSFGAILALLTIYDQELLLGLELTREKTVFFYLGLCGTIMAVARGMIPEEHVIFQPEERLLSVIRQTHFYPEHWKGKLHTDGVRREFSRYFDFRILLFLLDLLSILLTPLILAFSLPRCSEQLIDFFRDFTIHVDGLGYVCSFAVFDFGHDSGARRPGDREERLGHAHDPHATPTTTTAHHPGWGTGPGLMVQDAGKMEQSCLYFKANHPDWVPEHPVSLRALERMMRESSMDGSDFRGMSEEGEDQEGEGEGGGEDQGEGGRRARAKGKWVEEEGGGSRRRRVGEGIPRKDRFIPSSSSFPPRGSEEHGPNTTTTTTTPQRLSTPMREGLVRRSGGGGVLPRTLPSLYPRSSPSVRTPTPPFHPPLGNATTSTLDHPPPTDHFLTTDHSMVSHSSRYLSADEEDEVRALESSSPNAEQGMVQGMILGSGQETEEGEGNPFIDDENDLTSSQGDDGETTDPSSAEHGGDVFSLFNQVGSSFPPFIF
ncbi:MAG: autophagy protein Apg9-domain-containing protein [Piptocephalis tieghemiana]|nr:MAG: autophagy protein Apg9-domain-containing protein [Piptocephalis tieghemiana]